MDAFIKLANAQRNELSPRYFGDPDLEGHLPRARVMLDWAQCEHLARGDAALASAIQDCSIDGPFDASDESFSKLVSDFEALLDNTREVFHQRRHLYEEGEKQRTLHGNFVEQSAVSEGPILPLLGYNAHIFYRPTRAWQVKLWAELDNIYGEYKHSDLQQGAEQ